MAQIFGFDLLLQAVLC